MKKLLALVLALVMSMSLVTISNTAFKDADKITDGCKEAVDVMNAVGVLVGDENGNFNAKDTLTRAQAAKIISYLLLGNKTAEALVGSGKFTDVAKTNWAAGFVDYCAAVGVVNGVGNGQFDPSGSLTTLQFAKMLLVSLGYDAKIEGFVGSDWSINVSAKANQVGLMSGLDISANATLTREQAAKMTLNTLKSPLVEYTNKGGNLSVNGAEISIGASNADYKTTSTKSTSKQTIYADRLNSDNGLYIVEFAEQYYPDLVLTQTVDVFGRPANLWKYKANEVGTYVDDTNLQATYTAGVAQKELYNLVGSDVVSKLQNDNAQKDYYFEVYVDGEAVGSADSAKAMYFVKNSSADAKFTGRGVQTEVFMDDNSNVRIVVINTYLMKATADYNKTKELVTVEPVDNTATLPALPATIDNDDFDVADVKDGDYLLVTFADHDIQSVKPAEIITGKVTEYTVKDYVILGGTTYKYNKILKEDAKNETFTINENATLVLDAYGYIVYVDEALTTSSYVYISKFINVNSLDTEAQARAYFTDGTNKGIKVAKVNSVKNVATIGNYSEDMHKWYTYTVNSDGEYTLSDIRDVTYTTPNPAKNLAVDSTETIAVYNSKVKFFNSSVFSALADVKGNSNTVFLVKDTDGDVTSYTGIANVPEITMKDVSANRAKVSYVVDGGYASYVFIDLSECNGTVNIDDRSEEVYLFTLKATSNKTVVEGTEYLKYKVLLDGEIVEKYFATTITGTAGDVGKLFYRAIEDKDGYIKDAKLVETANTKDTHKDKVLSKANANDTITAKKNSVNIGGDWYVLSSKTKVNLIVGKNCPLLKDAGASYETYQNTTIGTITGLLGNRAITGRAFMVTDNKDSDVLEQLYVYVSDIAATDSSGAPTGEVYTLTGDVKIQSGKIKYDGRIVVDGSSPAAYPTAKDVVVTYTVYMWNSSTKQYEYVDKYTSTKDDAETNAALGNISMVSAGLPNNEDYRVDVKVTFKVGADYYTLNLKNQVVHSTT